MRFLLIALALSLLMAPALAHDLGSQRPAKPQIQHPHQPGQPDRQGGDTIADAFELWLPVYDAYGSTVGYTDDYDEVCPYTGSTSPDVVYRFTTYQDTNVDIDMYGSSYDTKIYLYDEDLNLVACNDDFYPDYVSKIENQPLDGDITYYLVIDGYGGDAGDYVLNIEEFFGHGVGCPGGDVQLEGEPELVDGYEDAFNGGCNSPQFDNPFGTITHPIFCGRSGWYLGPDGSQFRDTDWFEVTVPSGGVLEIVGDADYVSYMFELGPQDCGTVGVIQSVEVGPFNADTIIITGEVGSTVWFWFGPATWDGDFEYDYLLFTNLEPPVATEAHSLSSVKSLFR